MSDPLDNKTIEEILKSIKSEDSLIPCGKALVAEIERIGEVFKGKELPTEIEVTEVEATYALMCCLYCASYRNLVDRLLRDVAMLDVRCVGGTSMKGIARWCDAVGDATFPGIILRLEPRQGENANIPDSA